MGVKKWKVITPLILTLVIGLFIINSSFAIDINASPDLCNQLLEVDGIGNTLATRCVAYRDLHKPIEIDELDNVPGIGPVKLKLIKKKFRGR